MTQKQKISPISLRIIRAAEVMARTGLSRSTLYLRIATPGSGFPKQISLGSRAVGWIESEIDDWISTQISSSRIRSKVSPQCGAASSKTDKEEP